MKIIKKYSIVLVIVLQSVFLFGQEIKSDLPTIIPPSPTVAALMKFEEVPVSNYTGVPDISIPLFSTGTLSKDVNLDISLKYHPSGVAANEVASDVGLGWSLFAGGTISRTVRGLPDEVLILPNSGPSPAADSGGEIGIYHNELTTNSNPYYNFINNPFNYIPMNYQKANEFIWSVIEKNKYDTEHDLWEFNFMGKSGRFYIKKVNNQLIVLPLDDYRISIINSYTTVGNNPYIPIGFIVYDEKGYKYQFDVSEVTRQSHVSTSTYTSTTYGVPGSYTTTEPDLSSFSVDKAFISAFHLSKVYDNNNKLLIEFLFNDNNHPITEARNNFTETFNDYPQRIILNGILTPINDAMIAANCFNEFKPYKQYSNNLTSVRVKKINRINVIGFAHINIIFELEREDNNLLLKNLASKIKSIEMSDWNNTQVKKYNFNYGYTTIMDDYSTIISKRLILKKIEEVDSYNLINGKYEFDYKTNQFYNSYVGKDSWGFFNLYPTCELDRTNARETTPSYCTTDVLQKIKYPTGGCAIFDFEPNQYSFIGSEEITDYDSNPDNFQLGNTEVRTFMNNQLSIINSNSENRKVKFYPSIVSDETTNRNFTLKQKVDNVWVTIKDFGCPSNQTGCCINFLLEKDKEYGIRWNNFDEQYHGSDTVTIEYFNKTHPTNEFLYGGGNRIKRIGYFDVDVPQDYYNSISIETPKKEKKFSYKLPSNSNKSSGSLVFNKPLFSYDSKFSISNSCYTYPNNAMVPYKANSNISNISVKTNGADIGYKYVTIKETGNGETRFIYTSPLDYEEEKTRFNLEPPFLPVKNIDYKRGLLLKEEILNQNSQKLIETLYDYTFENYMQTTGLRFLRSAGIPELFSNAGSYFNSFDLYDAQSPGLLFLDIDYTFVSLGYNPLFYGLVDGSLVPTYTNVFDDQMNLRFFKVTEAYGWAKLTNKTTKNYFYDSSSNQKVVQTNETYTYNPINKLIDEQTTSNSRGEILKTKYYYHTGNSLFSQNRISEIEKVETFRDTQLLSTTQIDYSNGFADNTCFLPQTIETSKGSANLENRVRYNRYDEFGHPLEVQQENGTLVSYIWGYNKTQPIAKIENASYGSIDPSLITYVQGKSNNSVTGTETNLLSALTDLRAALPNAMITTYTYIPLVGISTITGPNGDKQTFTYDSFGRLQSVHDKEGNVLSENEYHYRTQN